MWGFFRKPERFSVAHLQQVQGTIVKLSGGAAPGSQAEGHLVTAIKELSELLVYSDKRQARFFELFCEWRMLRDLARLLRSTTHSNAVKTQVLQTVMILLQNLDDDRSLLYMLSNNQINQLLDGACDACRRDEELLAYTASFMRALSLRVNAGTVHFFLVDEAAARAAAAWNAEGGSAGRGAAAAAAAAAGAAAAGSKSFPLYTRALSLFDHQEGMVRIAARTVTLHVYRVEDPSVDAFACSPPHSVFLRHVGSQIGRLAEAVQTLCDQILSSTSAAGTPKGPAPSDGVSESAASDTTAHTPTTRGGDWGGDSPARVVMVRCQELLSELGDLLFYAGDVSGAPARGVAALLDAALWEELVMSTLLPALDGSSGPRRGSVTDFGPGPTGGKPAPPTSAAGADDLIEATRRPLRLAFALQVLALLWRALPRQSELCQRLTDVFLGCECEAQPTHGRARGGGAEPPSPTPPAADDEQPPEAPASGAPLLHIGGGGADVPVVDRCVGALERGALRALECSRAGDSIGVRMADMVVAGALACLWAAATSSAAKKHQAVFDAAGLGARPPPSSDAGKESVAAAPLAGPAPAPADASAPDRRRRIAASALTALSVTTPPLRTGTQRLARELLQCMGVLPLSAARAGGLTPLPKLTESSGGLVVTHQAADPTLMSDSGEEEEEEQQQEEEAEEEEEEGEEAEGDVAGSPAASAGSGARTGGELDGAAASDATADGAGDASEAACVDEAGSGAPSDGDGAAPSEPAEQGAGGSDEGTGSVDGGAGSDAPPNGSTSGAEGAADAAATGGDCPPSGGGGAAAAAATAAGQDAGADAGDDAESGGGPAPLAAHRLRREVPSEVAEAAVESLARVSHIVFQLLSKFASSCPRAARAALCSAESAVFDHCGGASMLPLYMVTKARPSAPPSAVLERLSLATPVPLNLCEDVDVAKGVVAPLWVTPDAILPLFEPEAAAAEKEAAEADPRRPPPVSSRSVPGRLLPPAIRTTTLEALRLRWLLFQMRRPRRHDAVLERLRPPRHGIKVGMTFTISRHASMPALHMQVSPAAAKAITAERALAGPPGTPTGSPQLRPRSRRAIITLDDLSPVDRAIASASTRTKGGRVPARPVIAVIGNKFLVLARPQPAAGAIDDSSSVASAATGSTGAAAAADSRQAPAAASVAAPRPSHVRSAESDVWWDRLVLPRSGAGNAVSVAPLHACCASVCEDSRDTVAVTVASVEPIAMAVSVEAAAPSALSPPGASALESGSAAAPNRETPRPARPSEDAHAMRPAAGNSGREGYRAAGGSAFEAEVARARVNADGGREPRLWRMWLRAKTPEAAQALVDRLQVASDEALTARLAAWRSLGSLPP
ncbi:hypothetical protein FNF29_01376 [Cafeteria roenbergensis]|uniref:FPL domain-containing protein n=1 Tax=Cafeteria roenbergensis TaxID=33653 RepID=A0A5A8CTZ5_CAFRO|nr:hypothetical protein FNF29_01376 [Cafeteria roenbergensis]|eukprot:KAA0155957.1 hypothetical protein FNF29_01376 [Cafeteria roenbergensis]